MRPLRPHRLPHRHMAPAMPPPAAPSGHTVFLPDTSEAALAHALATIRHNLGREAAKGILTLEQVVESLNRITFTTTLEDLAPATLAIEAAPERLDIKLDLFRKLDTIL